MNIPPNQQPAGGLPMSHMAQPANPQMSQGQQRITQQGQQQGQHSQQMAQQSQLQMQQFQQQQQQGQHSQQMAQQSQIQMQQFQQQKQQLQQLMKTDEDARTVVPKLYAKVKSLLGPLRETLTRIITIAAQSIQQNSQLDAGTLKSAEPLDTVFNKAVEEFYSICDQMEFYLQHMIELQSLNSTSERYMPLPVVTLRNERTMVHKPALNYSQFLTTVKHQVSHAQAIHDALMSAAQSLAVEDPLPKSSN